MFKKVLSYNLDKKHKSLLNRFLSSLMIALKLVMAQED